MSNPAYRGRFAPTPSGPLHFGSLVAALASFLEARAQGGVWLLRIEDVDPPRVVPGAAEAILHTLEAFGFEWDGEPLRQSRRLDAYRAAIEGLREMGLVYACRCSRRQIAATARRGVDGPVYPGSCTGVRLPSGWVDTDAAVRLRVPDRRVGFEDAAQGWVACQVARECGDFVLRRGDGVYTYQLAVVVDDAEQGITHVVRGADLLTSTPRQIVLQRALGLPTPEYLHLPVVLDGQGEKLSKQTLATPIDPRQPWPALRAAMCFLGIQPPHALASVAEFWAWAAVAWGDQRWRPVRGRRMVGEGGEPDRQAMCGDMQ